MKTIEKILHKIIYCFGYAFIGLSIIVFVNNLIIDNFLESKGIIILRSTDFKQQEIVGIINGKVITKYITYDYNGFGIVTNLSLNNENVVYVKKCN